MAVLQDAIAFHKQGRYDKAENCYLQALEDNPDSVDAHYLLGTLWLQNKKTGIAAVMFEKALQLKPDHFEALNNLGNCHMSNNRAVEARKYWEMALRVPGKDPKEYADLYNNIATIYVNAGEPGNGLPLVEKALAMNPGQADAGWNKSLMLLEQGKYGEGFDLYHYGVKTKNRQLRNYGENVVPWDGSEGKNVIVWGEQGIGDEILFASMIPDLQRVSNKVIFDCHPRLVNIFKESFPDVPCYGTRKDEFLNWTNKHPEANAKISIGDLGRFFRRELKDFPRVAYLKAKAERVEFYKGRLSKMGDRLKVGISWTGGYKKTRKDYRSIPLSQWKPILACDADFISLQYTPDAYEYLAGIEEETGVRVHHWPTAVYAHDYMETAALVDALDLVITVNTAAHHLAGALGKECWTLTPKAHAWRYWSPDKDGHSIPWYPNCYQYMQKNLHDWDFIMNAVSKRLSGVIRESQKEEVFCDA